MVEHSGIGTYIKNIVPGLIESGVFTITCLGYKGLQNYDWLKKTTFIELYSPIFSLKEQLELFYKTPKCDIFWSPNWNISFLPLRAKKRVVTIHDVYHLSQKNQIPKLKYLFVKTFINCTAFYADEIVTVSDFSKEEIIKYLPIARKKIVVSYSGIGKTLEKDIASNVYKGQYLLFVGNIKRNKNVAAAIKAYKLLLPNYKFYIVGDTKSMMAECPDLQVLLEGMEEKIIFAGKVSDSDLYEFYANATAFIFPSVYEGFGFPVLEAMKFMLPIAASNSTAIPEAGGTCIEYFDPYSIDEIAKAIKKVMDRNYKIDRVAYEAQLNKFTWSATVNNHIKLLIG